MNLYTILISDVATGCIVGWAVSAEGSHKETPEMVRNAVKMAVINSGAQTMFEFVSDNHGAFTDAQSKAYLNDVFDVVRTIKSHNSQANPAETQFRLFKNSTLRSLKNFVRSSHDATIANRANLDKIETWEYPTYAQTVEQLNHAINTWNNTKRRGADASPTQILATNKHPQCQPIDPIRLRRITGTHTKVEISQMRGFVKVGAKHAEMQYEIPPITTPPALHL